MAKHPHPRSGLAPIGVAMHTCSTYALEQVAAGLPPLHQEPRVQATAYMLEPEPRHTVLSAEPGIPF